MSEPTPDLTAVLTALMESCGRAMFDDTGWIAPVYIRGEVVGGQEVNAFEAAPGLDAVAHLIVIPGPTDVYDRLCDADTDPNEAAR